MRDLEVGDHIICKDWNEVRFVIQELASIGYDVEIKGWEDVQNNAVTITGRRTPMTGDKGD